MNLDGVVRLLANQCAMDGQKAWAEQHGLSPQYVNDVLKRQRRPGKKILDALEIEKVVTYHYKHRDTCKG